MLCLDLQQKGRGYKGTFLPVSFWFQRAGLVALYVFLKEKWNGTIIVTKLSFYINTRSIFEEGTHRDLLSHAAVLDHSLCLQM